MNILAIDTATEACSVALSRNGQVHARFEVVGRAHTRVLLPMLDEVLAEADVSPAQIDLFACGVGPGSFAGVRIGVGIVKGLALALERPVVAVSSLALIAQQAFDRGARGPLAVSIDARMGEVYFATFGRGDDGLALQTQAPLVCDPRQVPLPGGPVQGAGSGYAAAGGMLVIRFGEHLSSVDVNALPDAAAALRLAEAAMRNGTAQSADALEPLYVRNQVALTMVEQALQREQRSAGRD